MKIESLQVQMASQHSASQRTMTQTTITDSTSKRPPSPPPAASTQVSLSPQAEAISDNEQALEADPNYALVKALYEQITGLPFNDAQLDLQHPAAQAPAAPVREVTLTHKEIHTEAEQTQFSAQGHVTTADGRQIAFDFQFNLQRSHTQASSATLQVGPKVKDPLVLNFDGGSAQLSDGKVSFDLNGDGQAESVSFVTGGSGFLAIDKNADGVINNGTELFGPGSGDGFAELAAYDADQNQVIDENDPVFSQLRVFNKDAAGQDQLATLAEKGVGAILLAHADTPFEVKDAQNQLQGRLRASGVYLRESGGVGSVQQIDLRV